METERWLSNHPANLKPVTPATALEKGTTMTTKPALTAVETAATTETAAPDPLDLKSLALPQNFVESAGVKKLTTTVPVRKPNPQDFIRTHPSPEFRRNLLMVNLKDEREFYVVVPALANALAGETVVRMVVTAITRQGVTFLWPLPLPGPDGKDNPWWRSGREAASLAQDHWIRVKANMSLG